MNKTIYIDSTNIITDLCIIGGNFNTDKSPFALNSICCQHRKGYTAFYTMIFSQYKNKNINLLEIGIEEGSSLQTWSKWFLNANIYAFEFFNEKIQKCKNMNIDRVTYYNTDVSDIFYLDKTMGSLNILLDIIIDDSSHILEHQNNIIKIARKYLKSGGILIIEDINRNIDISNYIIDENDWIFYTFVICHHDNRHCSDNDKILYLIKK